MSHTHRRSFAKSLFNKRGNTVMVTVRHLSMEELVAGLTGISESPKDAGVIDMIVRRPNTDQREVLERAELSLSAGLVGDNWHARGSRATADGGSHPEMQITIMNSRVIALIAQDRERWQLAGDQLFIDLDLAAANLPQGTRLALGSALVEITSIPHNGCKKFVERFGLDAMKFVNSGIGKQLRLRGANAKVVQAGVVRRGEIARKVLS
jgi:hypothetical protein